MKKLTIFGALLVMLLTASAPLVLAQQAPTPVPPSPAPPAPVLPPEVTDDTVGTVGPAVGCQELYDDPTAFCIIDENGLITLPDGSQAPVFVQLDGTAYVRDASGALVLIGEGASFILEDEESAGDGQYENAEGELPVSVSPETAG